MNIGAFRYFAELALLKHGTTSPLKSFTHYGIEKYFYPLTNFMIGSILYRIIGELLIGLKYYVKNIPLSGIEYTFDVFVF